MALPVLDATFASIADLPRKQMLAKWLVSETGETFPSNVLVSGLQGGGSYVPDGPNGLYTYAGTENGKPKYEYVAQNEEPTEPSGTFILKWEPNLSEPPEPSWVIIAPSTDYLARAYEDTTYPWESTVWEAYDNGGGSPVVTESPAPSVLSNYYSLPERYLWAKIAVAAGAPKTEADYISLPVHYALVDIYKAISGRTDLYVDTDKKAALASIAAAYRGDLDYPERYATYLSWPWRYIVASIISHLMGNYNAVIVSGAGTQSTNGTYTLNMLSGQVNGKNMYSYGINYIAWGGAEWLIFDDTVGDYLYASTQDTKFPWEATFTVTNGDAPAPTLTPTNV